MKTIWRIRTAAAKHVALQFPEGLLMYACAISDILESFAGIEETFILGDVTYGACCIDDLSAAALGADFLVHYGHSCLVPLTTTKLPCLYVFVEITVDFLHLIATVERNFDKACRLLLAGTIQFSGTLQVRAAASHHVDHHRPQIEPHLARGSALCIAPARESAMTSVVV